jgi:hypothetical protein
MPVIRPSIALRAARNLQRSSAGSPTATTTSSTALTALSPRAFSSTARNSSSDSHEPAYDPPSGWLFGVRPGEKYQKEGWEGPMFYGFCGSFVIFAIALAFKPDTS